VEFREFDAGGGQTIVVYDVPDNGYEINAGVVFQAMAADAERRAAAGHLIVSMTTMALRHGGVALGLQGSGFTTKAAVAVVYAGLPPS
jgi:hypothetical protein